MIRRLVEALFSIPASWLVAAVFLVPSLETALLVGFVLPGESVVLLGGVLAARGHVGLPIVLAAAVLGPLAGDVIGYMLGRRYGEEIVRRRLGRRWDRAHRWLSRKGGWPIFVGRFVPFVRTVLPSTAGAIRAPRSVFLAWDLSAAIVWGIGTVLLGYFAARNYERLLSGMSTAGLVLLIAAVLAAAAFLLVRARRSGAQSAPVRSPSRPRRNGRRGAKRRELRS